MDNRLFWLTSLLLVGVLGWAYFSKSTLEADGQTPPAPGSTTSAAAAPTVESSADKVQIATGAIVVRTPKYEAVFEEQGGRLSSFKLNDFLKRKLDSHLPSEKMELINQANPADYPLRLMLSDASAPQLGDAPFIADVKGLTLSPGQTKQLTMTYHDPNGLVVSRIFSFNAETYKISQKIIFDNSGGSLALDGQVTMRINSAPFHSKANARYDGLGAYINNKLITGSASDAASVLGKHKNDLASVDWLGYMDQYFITAILTPDANDTPGLAPPILSAAYQDHGGLAVGVSNPLSLAVGKKSIFSYDFYYGPKRSDDLKAAGHNLTKSIDLGWFSFLALPLAALLKWIYSWCGNYGVAIILVTILIKIALWPLTAKSYRSMKEMQKLQPKVMKLREKYADNKEAMNREIMQLYKTFKVSPLGGCLPMLLQIPFFIAFYRTLDSLLELRGAPFMLWIKDLAAPDRLGSLNFTIPFFEPPTGLPVLTLLMSASMILQQKMTPTTMGDPVQAKMMMMMPLVFTVILINMPAGLVLYWLVNNLLSIGQQKIVNRPDKPGAAKK